ncbi:adenylate/guanylate cyclase domain-containing protein [Leptospira sp. 'Mane']|uniref:adenylate/guanylate cyclase domain-containing protein n=1 Tax=Leptospira sp. 'Mane' TaxID=3387407 RepID=UPI00398B3834
MNSDGKKAQILIVDDSEDNREILQALIEDMGHSCAQAENGQLALYWIEANSIDLILLDVNMPVLDGYSTLKKIRDKPDFKHIPILMVSAVDEVDRIVDCLQSGADDFISKPFEPDILRARVKNCLSRLHFHLQERKLLAQISEEKDQSEYLLLNILPEKIAAELKTEGVAKPQSYEQVSVLFTDIVGFTIIAEKLSPQELIDQLNSFFVEFDEIIYKYNLEKIKTIGDAYMCAGGIPLKNSTNAIDAVRAGLAIQKFVKDRAGWELRLGIHTGPVVAGVIGKKKFAYDIWGDAVNVAARIESSGEPGKVNISEDTYFLVKDFFECEHRGKIKAKNKDSMDMYFVLGEKNGK